MTPVDTANAEIRRALLNDPIVWQMAEEVDKHDLQEVTTKEGRPSELFTRAASAIYRERGGTVKADAGVVSEVLISILSASPDELVRLWHP